MRPRLIAPVLFVVLPLALIACGGDDDTAVSEQTTVTDLELEPIDGDGDDQSDGDGDGDGDDQGDGTANGDGEPADDDTDGAGESAKPAVELPETLPTELVITDLTEGTGPAAESGDTVVVDYVGVRSEDGAEFDNSYDREIPFNVRLGEGRVIPGWDEGLVGTRTGTRRQLDIPADLAYGDSPPGGSVIQAGDALTFVVDVRAVIPSVDPSDAPTDLDIEPSTGRTELGIVDVEIGDGPAVEADQTAIAHLLLLRGDDLEVLESTWEFDDPAQVVLSPGGAIEGLVDGLLGMQVGGVRIISMPPELAFGDEGVPEAGLGGDVDVIIVAELVGLY